MLLVAAGCTWSLMRLLVGGCRMGRGCPAEAARVASAAGRASPRRCCTAARPTSSNQPPPQLAAPTLIPHAPPSVRAPSTWRAPPHGAPPPSPFLQVPEQLTVLSNARELSSPKVNGQKVVQFETTPRMSPYLLAIAAGNLERYAGGGLLAGRRLQQRPGEAEYGFWAVPGLEWQLEMAAQVCGVPCLLLMLSLQPLPPPPAQPAGRPPKASSQRLLCTCHMHSSSGGPCQLRSDLPACLPCLQVAPKAFAFFERYTNFSQPMSKFDFVAVPGKYGAMEVRRWCFFVFLFEMFSPTRSRRVHERPLPPGRLHASARAPHVAPECACRPCALQTPLFCAAELGPADV